MPEKIDSSVKCKTAKQNILKKKKLNIYIVLIGMHKHFKTYWLSCVHNPNIWLHTFISHV